MSSARRVAACAFAPDRHLSSLLHLTRAGRVLVVRVPHHAVVQRAAAGGVRWCVRRGDAAAVQAAAQRGARAALRLGGGGAAGANQGTRGPQGRGPLLLGPKQRRHPGRAPGATGRVRPLAPPRSPAFPTPTHPPTLASCTCAGQPRAKAPSANSPAAHLLAAPRCFGGVASGPSLGRWRAVVHDFVRVGWRGRPRLLRDEPPVRLRARLRAALARGVATGHTGGACSR